MDLEFIKAYVSMLTPDNLAMVGMFDKYWEKDNSAAVVDGISNIYALEIDAPAVFSALVANNDIVKVLNMLIVVSERIDSISSCREEDEVYARCLNDWDSPELKKAIAGLQFFGFGNKEKPNTKKIIGKSNEYKKLEIDYLHDKTNGFHKDITSIQSDIKASLKKNKNLLSDRDINNSIEFDIAFEDGTKFDCFKITQEELNKKHSDGVSDIVLVSWDISESKFDFIENHDPKETGKEVYEIQMDGNDEIHNSIIDALNKDGLSAGFDASMSRSTFTITIKELFDKNDKYKRLLEEELQNK